MEKAADETRYTFSGPIKPKNEKEHYSLSYESFVVPLTRAIQQQQIIESQQRIIKKLNYAVDGLSKQVQHLARKK